MYLYVMDINFASFYIFTIALFGVCYVVLMFLLQIILFNEWSYLHFVLILCSKVQTLMLNIKPVVIYIANTRPIGREKLQFADISRKNNTIAKRKKRTIICKTLHRKLQIKQPEHHQKPRTSWVLWWSFVFICFVS
jgi:hypothetical protein